MQRREEIVKSASSDIENAGLQGLLSALVGIVVVSRESFMSTRKFTLAGVVTASFIAVSWPAVAADIAAPIEPATDWTAFHIGIGGGYGAVLHDGNAHVESDREYTICTEDCSEDFFDLAIDLDDLGDEGGILTVEGGFDFQLADRFVIGVLGDFTWANFDSSANVESCGGICLPSLGASIGVELDDMWTIAGRFGFLSSPDTLWYGLVGWTHADVDVSGSFEEYSVIVSEGFSFEDDESLDGITAGAGVETMLTDHLSLKLEYRYTDLDSISGLETFKYDRAGGEFEYDFDTTVQTIRAVLSFRFGGGIL
jgi:outer membrane immunogenic protein